METMHGRVDVLFANAGHVNPMPFYAVAERDFDMTVDTNIKALSLRCRRCFR
jgi:NADP-dependent 3-hydroxy acid dehydrogenase YdfG